MDNITRSNNDSIGVGYVYGDENEVLELMQGILDWMAMFDKDSELTIWFGMAVRVLAHKLWKDANKYWVRDLFDTINESNI